MLNRFCLLVDGVNERVGRYACWLILPLTLVVFFDVLLRYAFNSPTIWAWDVGVQLLGAIAILGGAYALLHGAHIGIDVIAERMTPRKRRINDFVMYLLFFFSVGILAWKTTAAAWTSVETREKFFSFFMSPIYPLKAVMAVGVLLLLLQGVSNFLHLLRPAPPAESGEKK